MRGILAITYLPVSQFAQNDSTNNETARLSLIGILSPDSDEYLSMEHSRSANYTLLFKPGERLFSNRFRPLLRLLDDTSPGYHDTLHAACSAGSNRFYNAPHEYPNCQDNLLRQMADRGIRLEHVPCPWNVFEHALVGQDYALADEASAAAAGDYAELEALEDLILVCSACPSRVGRISGDMPRGAAIDILQGG